MVCSLRFTRYPRSVVGSQHWAVRSTQSAVHRAVLMVWMVWGGGGGGAVRSLDGLDGGGGGGICNVSCKLSDKWLLVIS